MALSCWYCRLSCCGTGSYDKSFINSLTLQAPVGQGAPPRSILYKSGASDVIIINNLTNAAGGVLNNGGSGNVAAPTFTGNLWTIAGTSTILSDQGSTIVGYPLVCPNSSIILTTLARLPWASTVYCRRV